LVILYIKAFFGFFPKKVVMLWKTHLNE